jgi:hypothetical protein
MATPYETESSKVGAGWNLITARHGSSGYVYFEGAVVAPEGIVEVYSEMQITSMHFVWNGRIYRRTWRKRFSPRGLSRLAKAFAKEIATQNNQ